MEWQSIETAPRDGTVFLAINARRTVEDFQHFFCLGEPPPEGKVWAAEAGWRRVGGSWPAYPTHWMPLLKSPAPAQAHKE